MIGIMVDKNINHPGFRKNKQYYYKSNKKKINKTFYVSPTLIIYEIPHMEYKKNVDII